MKTGSDSFSEEGALNTQIGGAHYLNMPIPPAVYIFRNNLGFIEGNADRGEQAGISMGAKAGKYRR